jgi:nitric oxide reductase subunit C
MWNWERSLTGRLLPAVVMTLIALAGGESRLASSAQAAGGDDAKRGEAIYARLPCASCHDITKPWPGGDVCPNLGNIASEALRIVRSREYRGKARDAAGYIRESIVAPNAYIVPGEQYRTEGGKSVMPEDVAKTLTARELDDLVAYLMTRR